MTSNSDDHEVFIDRAVRVLRDLPIPAGPSAEIVEQVQLSGAVGTTRPPDRRRLWPRSILAIAATAAALFLALLWMPTGSREHLVFAQVQAQVAKTKSVQYVRTNTYPKSPSSGAEVEQVTILGTKLRRSEMNWEKPVFSPFPNARPVRQTVSIVDLRLGKRLTLYPDIKEYVLGDVGRVLADRLFSMPERLEDFPASDIEAANNQTVDFYESFRKMAGGDADPLPEQKIAGKSAVGFVVEAKAEQATGTVSWKRTCWVDVSTKLPVRIEASYRSTLRPRQFSDSDWVISEIVFDAPVDEKLFSIEPPEGWTDMESHGAATLPVAQ